MNPPERWKLLLEKAAHDEFTADLLIPVEESADEIIGFHLQQAAEKLLKALLSHRNISYRHTHDLGALMHTLSKNGIGIPSELDSIRNITPYAIEWRYDVIADEGRTGFNRQTIRDQIKRLRTWVLGHIK